MAFKSNDIQQKLVNIDDKIENGNMNVHSMIEDVTDTLVSAGNESFIRKLFKPSKKQLKEVNKMV